MGYKVGPHLIPDHTNHLWRVDSLIPRLIQLSLTGHTFEGEKNSGHYRQVFVYVTGMLVANLDVLDSHK